MDLLLRYFGKAQSNRRLSVEQILHSFNTAQRGTSMSPPRIQYRCIGRVNL